MPDAAETSRGNVRLSPSGEVFWIQHRDGEPVGNDTEPGTTLMQRMLARVLSWQPIDSPL